MLVFNVNSFFFLIFKNKIGLNIKKKIQINSVTAEVRAIFNEDVAVTFRVTKASFAKPFGNK